MALQLDIVFMIETKQLHSPFPPALQMIIKSLKKVRGSVVTRKIKYRHCNSKIVNSFVGKRYCSHFH